jgi:quercetin dioxygenase-like cupin family protein
MSHPNIMLGVADNLWSKQMHFLKAGDVEQGHKHCFSHFTLLAAGKLSIKVEGVASEFTAPHMIFIAAEKVHELTALEDNTVAYCIHPLRDGDQVEDILDPSMIPAGVNPETIAKPLLME